jgi:short-subunit dehydrogenase
VNNAGYSQVGPLELIRTEEHRAQFETNVIGLHATTNTYTKRPSPSPMT